MFEDERLRLYWRHPSPNTRGENEVDRQLAVSVNPESFRWSVFFVPLVGVAGWPWSRGESASLENAKRDSMARLMRIAGYHLQPTALAEVTR